MCKHEFGESYEAILNYKVKNPFCYIGSPDFRHLLNKERNGFARTCEKCGFTEFTTNTKDVKVANFE